jgi:hypothetical protein
MPTPHGSSPLLGHAWGATLPFHQSSLAPSATAGYVRTSELRQGAYVRVLSRRHLSALFTYTYTLYSPLGANRQFNSMIYITLPASRANSIATRPPCRVCRGPMWDSTNGIRDVPTSMRSDRYGGVLVLQYKAVCTVTGAPRPVRIYFVERRRAQRSCSGITLLFGYVMLCVMSASYFVLCRRPISL